MQFLDKKTLDPQLHFEILRSLKQNQKSTNQGSNPLPPSSFIH